MLTRHQVRTETDSRVRIPDTHTHHQYGGTGLTAEQGDDGCAPGVFSRRSFSIEVIV